MRGRDNRRLPAICMYGCMRGWIDGSWGESKTDVSVAGGSGTARVGVWEGNVHVMEKDRSYCLKNVMV